MNDDPAPAPLPPPPPPTGVPQSPPATGQAPPSYPAGPASAAYPAYQPYPPAPGDATARRSRRGCWVAAIVVGLLGLVLLLGGVVWLGYTLGQGADSSSTSGAASGDGSAGEATSKGLHTVGPGAEVTPALTGRAADQWAMFVRLIGTDEVTRRVATVRFYEKSSDDSEASVTRSSSDPTRFDLEVNLAWATDPKHQAFVLIHEYSHAVSLSPDQVSEVSGSCPRLDLDEGCASPESYLEVWDKKFWKPYGSKAPKATNEDPDKAAAFYEAHSGDFVDDYAATNIVEDFAQTFAFWVTAKDPKGSGLVAQKYAVLASFPDLVTLREQIQSRMDPAWLN